MAKWDTPYCVFVFSRFSSWNSSIMQIIVNADLLLESVGLKVEEVLDPNFDGLCKCQHVEAEIQEAAYYIGGVVICVS